MDNKETQPVMFDVVRKFFQEEQWDCQTVGSKPLIRAGYRGERGTWVCYAQVDEKKRRFLFHAATGMQIPASYWPRVIEYLNRVNCALALGNFELDVETGDVRYRAGVETPNAELSVEVVRAIAYGAVRALDHYIPGVVAVIHSGLSPEAALTRLDGQAVDASLPV